MNVIIIEIEWWNSTCRDVTDVEEKDDDDNNKYSEYLEEYKLMGIIKKYSDYIRYPIKMMMVGDEKKEVEKTINSMIPIWKKNKKDVKDEEYNEDRWYITCGYRYTWFYYWR